MGVRSSTASALRRARLTHMAGDATLGGAAASGSALPSEVPEGPFEFACPRCQRSVVEELYGPCGPCRTTLRALISADAREVESAAYEPKMNVTPNAVALKD